MEWKLTLQGIYGASINAFWQVGVKIWTSKKLCRSVMGTERHRARTHLTVVTTIALCTSCSQAKNHTFGWKTSIFHIMTLFSQPEIKNGALIFCIILTMHMYICLENDCGIYLICSLMCLTFHLKHQTSLIFKLLSNMYVNQSEIIEFVARDYLFTCTATLTLKVARKKCIWKCCLL